MSARCIYVRLSYDGSGYSGFQRQHGFITVQEKVEEAVFSLAGEKIPITGSGRTDAGVHAIDQVISFRASSGIPAEKWSLALNTKLPKDIRAIQSGQAPDGFSARYDAISKTYRYLMLPDSRLDAVMGKYAWVMRESPNARKMSEAAAELVGKNDFSAFKSAGSADTHPVRHLMRLEVEEGVLGHLNARFISITAEADGFLYKMARNIVGALVHSGIDKDINSPAFVRSLLEGRDRAKAPPPAPAGGLYLVRVDYPEGTI